MAIYSSLTRLNLEILVAICLLSTVLCVRTKEKIYVQLSGTSACFRRLNATHQVGCSSAIGGNVGVIHLVSDETDFHWLIKNGPHEPYMALIYAVNFTLDNVLRLQNSGRVNGIMVLDSDNDTSLMPEDGFSPDESCPGDQYGLYADDPDYKNCQKTTWNPVGKAMMFQDYSLPIFVLTNQTEINSILSFYETFNKPGVDGKARDYPLLAIEMKDAMDAAKDSQTCIRRSNLVVNLNPLKYCDPLGDQNVIATVKAIPRNASNSYSVIFAATRMDTFSLFENEYPSADSSVTGIVALLAAAEALAKSQDDIINSHTSKDIVFVFFNGEAFDYIGSSRMIYDMEHNSFPPNTAAQNLNWNNISHFIEVSQLGHRDEDKLWIHSDPISRKNETVRSEIDTLINMIKSIAVDADVPMDEADVANPLPPASVQQFLKKKNISSVVISDHKTAYTNKFYNSRLDVAKTINETYPPDLNETERYDYITEQAKMLANVSTTIARALYNLSTGDTPPREIEADPQTVAHMLYCFLHNPKCELFKQILDAEDNKDLANAKKPFPFYVGVDSTKNHVTKLTKNLLALFLGRKINGTSEDACRKQNETNKIYKYIWMLGPVVGNKREGVCIESTADETDAISPAFVVPDYDWSSGKYSTWTESSWTVISAQIFLVPSKQLETTILSVGVVILLVSCLLIWFCNQRLDILFKKSYSYAVSMDID
ncbi:hypothetical protein ScPMuIL_003459 [Solemya velum]